MDDIPDFEIDEDITNTDKVISDKYSKDEMLAEIAEDFKSKLKSNVDPLVYFSGAKQKAYIQEFIKFCAKGAFIIRWKSGLFRVCHYCRLPNYCQISSTINLCQILVCRKVK